MIVGVGEPWEVVGVVGDIVYGGLDLTGEVQAEAYFPLAQATERFFGFSQGIGVVVRTAGDALTVVPFLREAIAAANPQATVREVTTMEARLLTAVAHPRLGFRDLFRRHTPGHEVAHLAGSPDAAPERAQGQPRVRGNILLTLAESGASRRYSSSASTNQSICRSWTRQTTYSRTPLRRQPGRDHVARCGGGGDKRGAHVPSRRARRGQPAHAARPGSGVSA